LLTFDELSLPPESVGAKINNEYFFEDALGEVQRRMLVEALG
jgi:hypothetical protein